MEGGSSIKGSVVCFSFLFRLSTQKFGYSKTAGLFPDHPELLARSYFDSDLGNLCIDTKAKIGNT